MGLSVSVIIPCYNVENYISEAVQSVFQQHEQELEIICIDDCSTDQTFHILNEIKATHPNNFSIFRNETNKGAAFSRNWGLQIAKGTYIQFLDADDLLLPGKIAHQLNLCRGQNNLPGFIVGDYIKKNVSGEENIIIANSENVWHGLMQSRLGCTCSNLWNKDMLEAVGVFDASLKSSQEYDLMFRILKNGASVIYDNEPLTLVRERKEGSISSLNRGANWKRYVNLRCTIMSYLKSTGKLTTDNQNFFYQVLFDAIRSWYPYEHDEAFEAYKSFLPKDFAPSVSSVTSKNYTRLFRLIGFKCTEKIKAMMGTK